MMGSLAFPVASCRGFCRDFVDGDYPDGPSMTPTFSGAAWGWFGQIAIGALGIAQL